MFASPPDSVRGSGWEWSPRWSSRRTLHSLPGAPGQEMSSGSNLMFVLESPSYHVVSLVPDPLVQHPQAGRHPQPDLAVQLGDWVSFHLNYSALSDFWIFYRIIKLINGTIDTCEGECQLWCLRTLVVVLDSTVLNSWYPWAYHSWYRPTYRTTNSCKQRRSKPWEGHQVSSIKIMEWGEHR